MSNEKPTVATSDFLENQNQKASQNCLTSSPFLLAKKKKKSGTSSPQSTRTQGSTPAATSSETECQHACHASHAPGDGSIPSDDGRHNVISLFTNIPVDYTINLILDKLFDNDTDFVLKGIDKNNMRKLFKWTVQGGAFSFNGELFEQTDGVAMGGSLSCLMADVLMNHLVDKALSRTLSNHKPSIFYRYVDDCFAVFDSLDSIKIFCDSLNEVYPNIKFTTEIQNNKCINFLDVLVDNSSTTVTTSTFRKPTNTGLYSKWSSFVPRRYKYNLVNCLLDRAYKICSSYESICSEVDNIKVMLGRNGYPAYFLDSCVRRFFNRKYDKMLSHLEKRKNCRTVIARLPFLGDMSMQLYYNDVIIIILILTRCLGYAITCS